MCKTKMSALGSGAVALVLGALAVAEGVTPPLIKPATGVPWVGVFVLLAGLYLLYEYASWPKQRAQAQKAAPKRR